MSIWHDLSDLVEIYSNGGLLVITLMAETNENTAVAATATYQGKVYDQRGIRTLIQLDSDAVTIISPEVLAQPQVWRQHMMVVDSKLAILGRLQAGLKKSWVLAYLMPFIWFVSDVLRQGSQAAGWALVQSAVLSGLVYLGRHWILRVLHRVFWPLMRRAILWYTERRFQSFVAS